MTRVTTDALPRPLGSRSPGRPLSAELSDQLVSVAVDILADEGWGRLNSDRIAARAHAGKAGIYRRWPSMSALARHALTRAPLVESPADAGSLVQDLCVLLHRWTKPMDRAERAAASLIGASRHDDELRAGLDEALVQPLAAVVRELAEREAGRGRPLPEERILLLTSVVQALWWQRYTGLADEPLTPVQVEGLVTSVLLPLVEPAG